MYLTAPLALAGTAMAKSIMSFDDAMNKSVAIMGAQGQEMRAEMERTAIDISKTTSTTATEMAEGYFYLASAGLDAKQAIAALSVVEKFAVAGSFDLAKATTLAMDSQASLGMKSKDAATNMKNLKKVTDILVGANTLANASTEQFAIALTHGAGAAMKNFGIGLEDGIAILAAYADQGIKAERAGNMFSRMIRLQTAGVMRNKDAWKRFGVDIYDANNNLRPLTEMVKDLSTGFEGMSGKMITTNLHMLGFKARSQQAIFPLLGMTEKTRDFMNALSDMGGMAEEVAAYRLKSFSNQLQIAKNNITAASLSFKDAMIPYLEKLNKALIKTGNWFEALNRETKDAILKYSLWVAAIGPALIALSFFIKMGGVMVGTLASIAAGYMKVYAAIKLVKAEMIVMNTLSAAAVAKGGFGLTGLGASMAVIWGGAAIAITSVGIAIHQVLASLGVLGTEAEGVGDKITGKFHSIAIASAYMGTTVLMAWESIKLAGKILWSGMKVYFFAYKVAVMTGINAMKIAWGGFLVAMEVAAEAVLNAWIYALQAIEDAINALKPGADLDLGLPDPKDFDFGGQLLIDTTVVADEKSMKQLTDATGEMVTAKKEYDKSMKMHAEGLSEELLLLEEQFNGTTETAKESAEATADFFEETTEAAKDQLSTFEKWAQDNWENVGKKLYEYQEKTLDVWGNVTSIGIKAFEALGDGITDLLLDGEWDIKQWARAVIKELMAVLVKALMVKAAMAAFGGMGLNTLMQADPSKAAAATPSFGADAGATGSSLSPMADMMSDNYMGAQPPMHTGGIVGQGPLKSDERVIVAQTGEVMLSKEDVRGASETSSASQSSNFKIVNVLEKKEMVSALSTTEGEQAVINIMRRNKSTLSLM
jgi:TP901 family phage tail tape measure protein/lambda family phage tail tape measure protein